MAERSAVAAIRWLSSRMPILRSLSRTSAVPVPVPRLSMISLRRFFSVLATFWFCEADAANWPVRGSGIIVAVDPRELRASTSPTLDDSLRPGTSPHPLLVNGSRFSPGISRVRSHGTFTSPRCFRSSRRSHESRIENRTSGHLSRGCGASLSRFTEISLSLSLSLLLYIDRVETRADDGCCGERNDDAFTRRWLAVLSRTAIRGCTRLAAAGNAGEPPRTFDARLRRTVAATSSETTTAPLRSIGASRQAERMRRTKDFQNVPLAFQPPSLRPTSILDDTLLCVRPSFHEGCNLVWGTNRFISGTFHPLSRGCVVLSELCRDAIINSSRIRGSRGERMFFRWQPSCSSSIRKFYHHRLSIKSSTGDSVIGKPRQLEGHVVRSASWRRQFACIALGMFLPWERFREMHEAERKTTRKRENSLRSSSWDLNPAVFSFLCNGYRFGRSLV